jgi:hypothetical protein
MLAAGAVSANMFISKIQFMKKMILFGSSLCIYVFCLSQNVGIGNNNPTDKLTVSTVSGNYGLIHTDGTISVGTWVGNGAGYIGTKSVHPLRFLLLTAPRK